MSNKNLLWIGLALGVVVFIGGGLWAYDAVLGDTKAASSPITALPLALNTATRLPATATPLTTATTAAAATLAPTLPLATATSAPTAATIVLAISQAESQVRFLIYEELAGQPKTVVGTSNQVAGQLAINLADLSQSQIGVLQVNARTFTTDSSNRNRAIRNFILNTDQYEFITFTPTQLIGLSGAAQIGQPFTFQVVGDLTIRDVTQQVTFDVTATGASDTRVTGSAHTLVKRSDYGLLIPNVPNVANVGDEVTLEIDFVATAVTP